MEWLLYTLILFAIFVHAVFHLKFQFHSMEQNIQFIPKQRQQQQRRLLLSTTDELIVLLQDGKISWIWEESLVNIDDVDFLGMTFADAKGELEMKG